MLARARARAVLIQAEFVESSSDSTRHDGSTGRPGQRGEPQRYALHHDSRCIRAVGVAHLDQGFCNVVGVFVIERQSADGSRNRSARSGIVLDLDSGEQWG